MPVVDSNLRPPINPIQPGGYSAVDASALQGAGVATGPVLVFVGACFGGQPNVLYKVRDPQALKNRFRSGQAYDCARIAMGVGVNTVYVVRAGSTIAQATKILQNAGAATVVTLTSIDYGAWVNAITVQVAANNLVTIRFTDANGVTYTENFAAGAAATAQNIADAINGKTVGFSASQYVTAVAGVAAGPLAVVAASAMAGGSDGTSSALIGSDWTSALAALEGENVDIIVPATGDATVHAQVQTHCIAMSIPLARKERVGVYGAVLGESVAAQVTRMASLTDKRSQLVYPGMVDFDNTGTLKTWDPFYHAAKVAAMHALQPDAATSLLHQPVPGDVDVEQVGGRYLSTSQGSDVDTLLRANVTPVTPAPGGGFWVVDSLSGWTTDDSFRDFHKVRSADVVQQRLRTKLEAQFVGKKALNLTANAITDSAAAYLQNLKDETVIRDFAQVAVTPGADTRSYNVTARVLLVDAVKFIFITVALQASAPLNSLQPVADTALL